MLDENDIQKLLRLKRHEQPPAGYHENFLREFQRRQRAEALRQPAQSLQSILRMAIERLGAIFSEHSMGRLAYGTATAAVLVFAGIASFHMLNNGGQSSPASFASGSTNSNGSSVALNDSNNSPAQTALPAPASVQNGIASAQVPTSPAQNTQLQLDRPIAPLNLPEVKTMPASGPQYIIGTQPASYERPYSF